MVVTLALWILFGVLCVLDALVIAWYTLTHKERL